MDGILFLDNVISDRYGRTSLLNLCLWKKIAGGKLETEFKSFSTTDKDKEKGKAESKVICKF